MSLLLKLSVATEKHKVTFLVKITNFMPGNKPSLLQSFDKGE